MRTFHYERSILVNLRKKLNERAIRGKPVRIVLIGAGKFGSMFLAQARRVPGVHVAGIADLNPTRARDSLARAGWPAEQYAAISYGEAIRSGATFVTDDPMALIASEPVDVVIDATGSPEAGIGHVLACCQYHRHVVMVNVEADALVGPLLARRATESEIVYSLAYGDQPALICELVDWARTAGFEVIAAGKGTKYLPVYHSSTPDTVWTHYGFSPEVVRQGDFNPKMFNSFLDGTKSAIEMAAVANATGLTPAPEGLAFLPCGVDDLPRLLKPRAEGGALAHRGQVEVVSSLERDGRPVYRDLRWGVYVTFAADSDYVRRCFHEYGLVSDDSGNYSAMYKPFHLIGLELNMSIASVGLLGEPTGAPAGFRADVVAIAKRNLKAGETLDGEGGYTVYGRLMPAADSLAMGGFPIGLANGVKLKRGVGEGQPLLWEDVEVVVNEAVAFRREMEEIFRHG